MESYSLIIPVAPSYLKRCFLYYRYDVYKAFPPKIEPKFERDLPNQDVKTIIYPEDLVRA